MTESIPAEGYADAQGQPVGGTVERTPIGVADVMRLHGVAPTTYVPPVMASTNTRRPPPPHLDPANWKLPDYYWREGDPPSTWVHQECGALVADREAHEAWHGGR